MGVFRILYLSNWDIDSVWCLHAHCIVCDCVCVRVYVCSQCYCWPKAVSVHKLSVLLLAHFSVTVRVLALLFFLYLCSWLCAPTGETAHKTIPFYYFLRRWEFRLLTPSKASCSRVALPHLHLTCICTGTHWHLKMSTSQQNPELTQGVSYEFTGPE